MRQLMSRSIRSRIFLLFFRNTCPLLNPSAELNGISLAGASAFEGPLAGTADDSDGSHNIAGGSAFGNALLGLKPRLVAAALDLYLQREQLSSLFFAIEEVIDLAVGNLFRVVIGRVQHFKLDEGKIAW